MKWRWSTPFSDAPSASSERTFAVSPAIAAAWSESSMDWSRETAGLRENKQKNRATLYRFLESLYVYVHTPSRHDAHTASLRGRPMLPKRDFRLPL